MQRIADGNSGRMPYSWFYFDLVKNVSKDKTFHSPEYDILIVLIDCTLENVEYSAYKILSKASLIPLKS